MNNFEERSVSTRAIRGFNELLQQRPSQNHTTMALNLHIQHEDALVVANKAKERLVVDWRRFCDLDAIPPAANELFTDEDTRHLNLSLAKVGKRWKQFNKSRKGKNLGPLFDASTPPTIDTLSAAVEEAKSIWERKQRTKSGKVKACLVGFMSQMKEHETVFSIIPSDNIYTSILCGVVSTLVTTAETHQKIVEDLSQALLDINDELNLVKLGTKVVEHPAARGIVIDLYAEVFDFLCNAMDWYDKSTLARLGKSLGSGFQEQVKATLEKIKNIVNRLLKVMNIEAAATGKETQRTNQELLERVTNVERLLVEQEERRRNDPEASLAFSKIEQSRIADVQRSHRHQDIDLQLVLQALADVVVERAGLRVVETLRATEENVNYHSRINLPSPTNPIQRAHDLGSPLYDYTDQGWLGSQVQDPRYYAREEVVQNFGQQPYSEDGTTELRRMIGPDGSSLQIPTDGVFGIQNWLKETKSTTLWVEGPAGVPYPSGVSTTALYVSDSLAAAEIPCITFFPKSRYPTKSSSTDNNIVRDGTSAPQQRVLLNLLYSLLSQLISILPRVFNTAIGSNAGVILDKQRFNELDGTVESIEPAMALIRDLLPFAPQHPLVFVVDGLQLVESTRPETRTTLRQLVLLLKEQQQQAGGGGSVVKLLFTTDGQSQVLGRTIGFRERLDLSRSIVGPQPGRPPRGASSLSSVSLALEKPERSPVLARENEEGIDGRS